MAQHSAIPKNTINSSRTSEGKYLVGVLSFLEAGDDGEGSGDGAVTVKPFVFTTVAQERPRGTVVL
jgi:hypothetical protein